MLKNTFCILIFSSFLFSCSTKNPEPEKLKTSEILNHWNQCYQSLLMMTKNQALSFVHCSCVLDEIREKNMSNNDIMIELKKGSAGQLQEIGQYCADKIQQNSSKTNTL